MSKPPTEQDVAALVVEHLLGLQADVYQEVAVCGGVADIVAKVVAEIWIVEVKTGWSLALLEQCLDRKRRGQAHRVFAATTSGREFRAHAGLAEALGIGVFRVRPDVVDSEREWVKSVECEFFPPRITSRRLLIADELRPEHKTHARAGAVGGGGRWTPFRGTCEAVAEYVQRNPGASIKATIANVAHHYKTASSARNSIAHWVTRGKVAGVEFRDGALWPKAGP